MNRFSNSMLMAVIALFTISGCAKEKIAPDQLLEFDLVVLDKNGDKTNKLKQGENFFMGFEVSNHAEDTVFVSFADGNRLLGQFYKQQDFLAIYRRGGGIGNLGPVYIGKPYDPDVEINFPAINLPGWFLNVPPSGRQYTLPYSWLGYPKNTPLPLGNYYSVFEDKIIIEDSEIVIDTSIEFEVN